MNYREKHQRFWEGLEGKEYNTNNSKVFKGKEALKEIRSMYDYVFALDGYFEGTHVYMNEARDIELSLVFDDTYGINLHKYMAKDEILELIESSNTPKTRYLSLRMWELKD